MAAETSPDTSKTSTGSTAGYSSRGSQWPLWFGLFGGFAAWSRHLVIAYPLAYSGCARWRD